MFWYTCKVMLAGIPLLLKLLFAVVAVIDCGFVLAPAWMLHPEASDKAIC
jgi:hypothetical protein